MSGHLAPGKASLGTTHPGLPQVALCLGQCWLSPPGALPSPCPYYFFQPPGGSDPFHLADLQREAAWLHEEAMLEVLCMQPREMVQHFHHQAPLGCSSPQIRPEMPLLPHLQIVEQTTNNNSQHHDLHRDRGTLSSSHIYSSGQWQAHTAGSGRSTAQAHRQPRVSQPGSYAPSSNSGELQILWELTREH